MGALLNTTLAKIILAAHLNTTPGKTILEAPPNTILDKTTLEGHLSTIQELEILVDHLSTIQVKILMTGLNICSLIIMVITTAIQTVLLADPASQIVTILILVATGVSMAMS